MLRFWGIWGVLVSLCAATVAHQQAANAQTSVFVPTPDVLVRVRVKQRQISLTGFDIKIQHLPPATSVSIQRKSNHWLVLNRTTNQEMKLFTPQLIVSGMSILNLTKHLPNRMTFNAVQGGSFDVIAQVPLREYLAGVLPSEMPLSWPKEALMAQAVASRSYTLNVMNARRGQAYHVESTVMDQVYEHAGDSETAYEKTLAAKLKDILNETEGYTLTDQKSAAVKAYFHSDCGGKTENAHNVWSTGSPTAVVTDDYCEANQHGAWDLNVSLEEIKIALFKNLGLTNPGELLSIREFSKTPSGRADKLQLIFSRHPAQTVSGNDFRSWIGFDRLKSTRFQIARTGNGFRFKGRGFGHGAGMCQWGSRNYAKQGWNYQQILAHYYPQAKLQQTFRY